MQRRKFIMLIGGVAALRSCAAAERDASDWIPEHRLEGGKWHSLVSTGAEGRNVSIQYRFAGGDYDRVPNLAAELVSLSASLIVALPSTPAVLAAKNLRHQFQSYSA
jgi:putative ABC transport system substrate-binding protein